ncbi:MAG: hypothetical protein ACPHRO_07560 [Nannocystaceae bacterium]
MTASRKISWLWVIIGICVIVALNKTITEGFLANSIATAYAGGDMTSVWMYLGIGTVVSYGLGGAFVGIVSPGETITEPAIAAVAAALMNNVSFYMANPEAVDAAGMATVLGYAAVSAVLGFGGAMIGERIQGDNTDKMRERGELPPL